jgi:hypothetical protein
MLLQASTPIAMKPIASLLCLVMPLGISLVGCSKEKSPTEKVVEKSKTAAHGH